MSKSNQNDIMNKLKKELDKCNVLENREGQNAPLSSQSSVSNGPSLVYEYVISEERLNKAFDLLFEETMRLRIEKYGNNKNTQNNSNLCPSEHISSGGSADNPDSNRGA